ncbi:MAG: GNAT family N-acetyltransferase [Candidatus Lokiarchaeota archaeon]|nr:GNAT family N-acetyltransferase [Candidatus Lokiarchaeota archaeon]
MVNFIPIKLELHNSHLINLNEEYLSWIADEMQQRYSIDTVLILGESIRDYVKKTLEKLSSYIPPEGIYYIIQTNNSIIGMGALRKLNKNIGEIKRMYIKPKYRGKGFGKEMLGLLLKKGKEFGFSSIRLDTGKFMVAAQQVYRLAGFQEREQYLESEVPTNFLPYWLFMEKFI